MARVEHGGDTIWQEVEQLLAWYFQLGGRGMNAEVKIILLLYSVDYPS